MKYGVDGMVTTFQTGRKKYPSILLFDWEGRPLAELKLTRFVNSFDIDMVNKTLYVFDVYNDKMFAYDLSEVLSLHPKSS